MMYEKFIEQLNSGTSQVAAWCGLPDPAVPAILAQEDFKVIILDLQHGQMDQRNALLTIPLVAIAQKPLLARICIRDFAFAARLVDMGAAGIIAPMINSAQDAAEFVSYIKFPPEGARSWGPQGALRQTNLSPADYLAKANQFTLAFAMIETSAALDNIDAILATKGLDGIFIGPGDLSISLSNGRALDPLGAQVDEAITYATERAKASEKLVGVYGHTPQRAAELVARHIPLVTTGSDSFFLKSGAQQALKTIGSGVTPHHEGGY